MFIRIFIVVCSPAFNCNVHDYIRLDCIYHASCIYIMFSSRCRHVDMFCNIDLHFAFYRLLKPSGVFYTYFVLSKPGLGRGGVSILSLNNEY